MKTRSKFDPKATYRLLVAVQHPEASPELLDAGLKLLETPERADQAAKHGIFFGKYPPEGKLAFLFPGQGSQYPFMGYGLAGVFEEAAPVMEIAEKAFDRNPGLFSRIYPEDEFGKEADNRAAEALQETDVAQPAIGTISMVMHRILQRHGLYPDAACGHSFGELTALCAAGRISEKDFMSLAVARGRFMAEAGQASGDSGGMLAIRASAETIDELIRENRADVALANRNSPNQGVISGPTEEIERIREICRKNRIISAKLPVSAAFHSRLVVDAAAPFHEIVSGTPFLQSSIPVYSNTTAAPYPGDEKKTRALLGRHLLQPVNFMGQIVGMYEAGVRTFVEVGPKSVLTGLVKNILSDSPHCAFSVDCSGGRDPALLDLAFALCKAAALGYSVDLSRWPSGKRG